MAYQSASNLGINCEIMFVLTEEESFPYDSKVLDGIFLSALFLPENPLLLIDHHLVQLNQCLIPDLLLYIDTII